MQVKHRDMDLALVFSVSEQGWDTAKTRGRRPIAPPPWSSVQMRVGDYWWYMPFTLPQVAVLVFTSPQWGTPRLPLL
jgi:hypothetical protein